MEDILEHLQTVLLPAEFIEFQECLNSFPEEVEDWPKHWTCFDISQPINFN